MIKECPCRDCKEREVGCHGYCEVYKNWSEENRKLRENIQKKQAYDRYFEEDLIDKHMKKKVKKLC